MNYNEKQAIKARHYNNIPLCNNISTCDLWQRVSHRVRYTLKVAESRWKSENLFDECQWDERCHILIVSVTLRRCRRPCVRDCHNIFNRLGCFCIFCIFCAVVCPALYVAGGAIYRPGLLNCSSALLRPQWRWQLIDTLTALHFSTAPSAYWIIHIYWN